jgi:DNA-binding winged helix-turn-helix (wHTH) protein
MSTTISQPTRREVTILRWPAEARRREDCRAQGVPRLLVVEARCTPPMCVDVLEDWVRLPLSREDLAVRARTLAARARRDGRPVLDGNGVLRYAGRWLRLSPLETRIMRTLIGSYGDLVSRQSLTAAAWLDPDAAPRNSLSLHILRLRRAIAPLGLVIRTLWGRGYLLDAEDRRAGDGTATAPSYPST